MRSMLLSHVSFGNDIMKLYITFEFFKTIFLKLYDNVKQDS